MLKTKIWESYKEAKLLQATMQCYFCTLVMVTTKGYNNDLGVQDFVTGFYQKTKSLCLVVT